MALWLAVCVRTRHIERDIIQLYMSRYNVKLATSYHKSSQIQNPFKFILQLDLRIRDNVKTYLHNLIPGKEFWGYVFPIGRSPQMNDYGGS